MISKILCTDVLAIRCVDDFIFVGIGCVLNIFSRNTYKLEKKINCLYPYNIHGIVQGPNSTLTIFGAKCFCTYRVYKKQGLLMIEEECSMKHVNDWIIATKWLTYHECNNLYILLAHNNMCIYDKVKEEYQYIWCEEKCILYGGSIFINDNRNVTIFSGTVYQEILIWEVNHCLSIKTSSVLHRLQGHNGVIFSVIYDPIMQIICSTSDDRTVRLWKISNNKIEERQITNWKEINIELMCTMFGHTARVWKSIIQNKILITIGEDSLMCMWSLNGKLLNKICAHHGVPIWSIDVSPDNKIIFTGGADGAVYAWPFATDYIEKVVLLPKQYICNQPKCVCYLSSGCLLVLSEDGTVLIFGKDSNDLEDSLHLGKCNSYYIMEVSLCHSYVCFASRNGCISVFKESGNVTDNKLQRVLEEQIMESQIFSVQWLEKRKLIACGKNGILKIFNFTSEGSINVESLCILPKSRERWLTAAILYEGLLVCGDRSGNMHIFDFKKSNQSNPLSKANLIAMDDKPKQTFLSVHGKIGIQNFIVLNSKLVSTGRDGMLRFFELNEDSNAKQLHRLHKERMPMDWISGSLQSVNDVFILGFREMEFIIYSMLYHRTLLRVPCGGGHRSWDCMVLNDLITFLYIRNKQVYIFDFSMSSLTSPVLLNGFHTKEINCINSMLNSDQSICISGGEDGTLRIISLSNMSIENNFTFQTLGIFDGHISSIKFITCLSLQSNHLYKQYLVFSGGGRAQIKIWDIRIRQIRKCSEDMDISCHDISSHMLYGFDRYRKKQWHESNQAYILQPETRYMDIGFYRSVAYLNCVLLFVACADGFIRIFFYDISTKHMMVKVHAKCADRCITKISVLLYEDNIIVLAMSTDGIGRFINFTDIVSRIVNCAETETEEYKNCEDISIANFPLHQSGINSYDIKMVAKGDFLLATGGDDNMIKLSRFKIEGEKMRISLLSKWDTSNAHVAQITGLTFGDKNKIISVGVDQQVIVYSWKYCGDDVSVSILKKIYTFVTDAKGLTSWYNSKGETIVCVYGNGFEILIS